VSLFVLWVQIIVVLSILASISFVRRGQLCDKSFGTCSKVHILDIPIRLHHRIGVKK